MAGVWGKSCHGSGRGRRSVAGRTGLPEPRHQAGPAAASTTCMMRRMGGASRRPWRAWAPTTELPTIY